MSARVKSIRFNPNFAREAEVLPGVSRATQQKAEVIKKWAISIFDKNVRHTRPITVPPYRASFVTRKLPGKGWVLVNTDPVAILVEFGSHPGGSKTRTLGYRPLGKAVDIVASGGS